MPKAAPDAPPTARRSLLTALAFVLLLAAAAPFVILPLWSAPRSPGPLDERAPHAATSTDEARAPDQLDAPPESPGERIVAQDLPQTDKRWLLSGIVIEDGDRGVADAQVSVWALLGGDDRRKAHLPLATCQ